MARSASHRWAGSYNDYLRSAHWRETRARFWASRGGGCLCDACLERRATQVHHRTYKRIGRERLKDLAAVCDRCHREIHEIINAAGTRSCASLPQVRAKYRRERRRKATN